MKEIFPKGKFKVRVVSPWFGELETESACFSASLPADQADALLCDWGPSDELRTFPRRKAWYCCEPHSQFRDLGGGSWTKIRKNLPPSEFLCHNHPDERFRVPHVTHFEPLAVRFGSNRLERTIAVVSNHGGSPRRRHPGISYRNRFVTAQGVDLYGRESWRSYRARIFSRQAAPDNYVGTVPGDWPAQAKRDLLARYKAAIALENVNEENYFTEKFVEAVCAGCVPIYKPDSVSRSTVLEGAFWIDPTACSDDPSAVMTAALSQDLDRVQQTNAEWIKQNRFLAASSLAAVFERIAKILAA